MTFFELHHFSQVAIAGSCYFAKCLPGSGEFRGAVQRVRDLASFRRLAAEYFR